MTKEEARIRNEVLNGSGTSIKNIKHLSQNVRLKAFVEFDDDHSKKSHQESLTGKLTTSVINSYDFAVESIVYGYDMAVNTMTESYQNMKFNAMSSFNPYGSSSSSSMFGSKSGFRGQKKKRSKFPTAADISFAPLVTDKIDEVWMIPILPEIILA